MTNRLVAAGYMPNKVARSKKPLLKTLHTWIGIISGVFLSVVALTGSVILFRAEFERAAFPHSAASGRSRLVTIDEAAAVIAAARPDAHVRRVHIPAGPDDPYIFQVQAGPKKTERIAADATTGQILGTLKPGWVEWSVDLHRNLLSGTTGRGIVGVIGIILFVLSGTGLLMWLTGARNWRAWISVRRGRSATRFNYELHRASGLWAYAFLAVISFTGIERVYPNIFRDAVYSVAGKPAPRAQSPKNVKAELALSLGEYMRAGRTAMPDGVPVELRLPESKGGAVDLRLYRAGDLSPSGNHVYLHPATGGVVQVDRIADRPLSSRFLAAMAPIHYGQFGGMTIKVAWALFGLTPLLLFATGLIAWWRPKSKASPPAVQESELLTQASGQHVA